VGWNWGRAAVDYIGSWDVCGLDFVGRGLGSGTPCGSGGLLRACLVVVFCGFTGWERGVGCYVWRLSGGALTVARWAEKSLFLAKIYCSKPLT